MEQLELGRLAERAAELAERGGMEAAGDLSRLIHAAARRHGYAPWAMTSMIAGEWDRQGIKRVRADLAILV